MDKASPYCFVVVVDIVIVCFFGSKLALNNRFQTPDMETTCMS